MKAKEIETQATEDITFQCYDAPVTVDAGKFVFCPEINNKYVEFAGDCVDGEGQYTFNANYQSVPTNPTGPPDQSVPGFGTSDEIEVAWDALSNTYVCLFDGACRLALEATVPRSRHINWSKV